VVKKWEMGMRGRSLLVEIKAWWEQREQLKFAERKAKVSAQAWKDWIVQAGAMGQVGPSLISPADLELSAAAARKVQLSKRPP
jgi:predicted thioredoxin/glutaredoxin